MTNDDAGEQARLVDWARRDTAHQRDLAAVPLRSRRIRILGAAPGSCVVWSPAGTGRLAHAHPVPERAHPPLRPGGLGLVDTYLALDDVPLLQWRQSKCPTCEQLVRAAVARPAEIDAATAALRAITLRALDDPRQVVPALGWLFALLLAGFYRLTLDQYEPIVSHQRPDAAFSTLTRFDALRMPAVDEPPRFLVPTQWLEVRRGDAVARAAVAHRTHPGLALHLGFGTAALLDGHHRALAAAAAGERFTCLTVSKGTVASPPPPVGSVCGPPGPPQLHFRSAGVTLSSDQLPSELHPWLRAAARCSGRRWEWDTDKVDAWEAQILAAPAPVR